MAAGLWSQCTSPADQQIDPVFVGDTYDGLLSDEQQALPKNETTLSLAVENLRSEVAGLKEQHATLTGELTTAATQMAAKDEEIRNLRHAISCAKESKDRNGIQPPTPVSAKSQASRGDSPKRQASRQSKASSHNSSARSQSKNSKGTDLTPVPKAQFDSVVIDSVGPIGTGAGNASFSISLAPDAVNAMDVLNSESDNAVRKVRQLANTLNFSTLQASALGQSMPVQMFMFGIAFGGFVFVMLYASYELDTSDGADDSDSHRRLGGDASGQNVLPIMRNIAFSLAAAGLIAFIINLLKQPLILGYLLGGVLVGPRVLKIVPSHVAIVDLSSIGLVFLLFMVGLELDVKELLKMGKVVLTTGALQYPICVACMYFIFRGLGGLGVSYGVGEFSTLYVGMTCGISSTMLVVKQLSDQGEADSSPGRLTIGILIFQDIWAIIILAIQPKIANPEPLAILVIFGKIAILIIIAMLYAKYVMPAVLVASSKTVELMLVLALAWCFFIGCVAIGILGLGPELAALIAGVALATFPYSNEFNGKIRYIRDFFLTLFFVGIGMQIPTPDVTSIATAVLIAVVVLLVRWLGIFLPVILLGGSRKLGGLATINLSQISEFALVICSMGFKYDHVGEDTLTMITWTFAVLAILASYLLKFNFPLYVILSKIFRKILRMEERQYNSRDGEEGHHEERGILLLGFHRIAAMLISEFEGRSPQLLKQMHVIDFNEDIVPQLRKRGVKCSYGDFSSPDVLAHSHHGHADVVISTIPDSMLHGITNKRLLTIAKQVWPDAHTIGIADDPEQEKELYEAGVSYVLRSALLVAERLYGLLSGYYKQVHAGNRKSQLTNIFDNYKDEDESQTRSSARRRVSSYVIA